MVSRLPNELVALVHHVELAKAGWLDHAIERLVVGTIWMNGSATVEGVTASLRETFGVAVDLAAARLAVERLMAHGDLIELPDGRLKLSERHGKEVRDLVDRTQEEAERVSTAFLQALENAGVEYDPGSAWQEFEGAVLVPLVQELGARTFELLMPQEARSSDIELQELVSELASDKGDSYLRAVVAFLDPTNDEVRAYVLRTLNAYLFAQAAALDASTLAKVQASDERGPEFTVFVDTNFLFSILRLHENPANEAAEALDTLLAGIKERVKVALYVLPITVEEAKSVLDACIAGLTGIHLSPNVAEVLATRPELPGLTQKFAQEAARSDRTLTADDFFGPYAKALVPVLRERGVELYNEKMDAYRTDQAVIDDVLHQEEYQRQYRARGVKPYEANLHDVVLWHAISRKRPVMAESPADVRFWIVTEDYGFMGFDRYKRKGRGFPVCLLPTSLLQLLQFFVPRDDTLDAAIVSSIRLPFLFTPFDIDSEKVTVRILRSLSRYEGIEDLSPDTIARILTSEALRERLRQEPAEVKDDALLREAFVQETRELEDRLRATEAEVQRERERVRALEASQARDEREEARVLRELQDQYRADRERLAAVEKSLEESKREQQRIRSEQESAALAAREELAARSRATLVLGWTLCAVVLALLATLGTWALQEWLDWTISLATAASVSVALLVWLLAGEMLGGQFGLENWGLVTWLRRARVWLWSAAAAVVLGILASALWDAMRG